MSTTETNRPLAMVTGASAGIGYELAICCAKEGFDLLVVADDPKIHEAAKQFRNYGVEAEAIETDLATLEGVDEFCDPQVPFNARTSGHRRGQARVGRRIRPAWR